ncbi:MAG: hypothetical protein IT239_04200, partial [Bacteroidia bacterium]|nr:hypothetical protein [Bacteroidia bacterium]
MCKLLKLHLVIFLAIISIASKAQNLFKSIHQEESEYHQSLNLSYNDYVSINSKNAVNANQNQKTESCSLNKVVYGWHPYWVNGSESAYQWDKLTHLSYFSYEVNATTGNATTTNNWSSASVVSTAISKGVKVTLCVTLFSSHATFLNSQTAQTTLINNLISLVQARNAHGVNVDFEGMGASNKTAFANFMNNLADAFHTQIPGSDVSTVLYAVDWNGVFDINSMKAKVDKFIIMGYDYYYTGSTTAGPNDPLYQFSNTYNYTLSKSITYYLNIGCPPNKLILGLPYYGREYGTAANTIPSSVNNAPNSASRTYTVIKNNAGGNYTAANARWDGESYTPYFVFNNGAEWRQLFYNNDYSIRRRMQMINQRGLGGMGIWALSYDNGYNEYWNAIRDNFSTCAVTACSDSLFDMGGPAKNYYDNELYTYTIAPPNAAQVNLGFSQFNLGTGDTLWLYKGTNTSAPLIGKYASTNTPGNLIINAPAFTLKFKSNSSTPGVGYKAT